MNKIILTVEAGLHTLTREYKLETVLDEQVDLHEECTAMLEAITN